MPLMNNIYMIKNIEEVTQQVALSGAVNDINPLLPDVYDVQSKQIKPILGTAYYNHIVGRYNASTPTPALTDKENQLIFLLQKAIVNLALAQWTNIGNVNLNQGGIHERKDNTVEAAKQWRVDDLRDYLLNKGFAAIDEILQYLEENIEAEEFVLWKNSPQATINKEFIVPTAEVFNQWHDIKSSRRIFLTMIPLMRSIETFHMKPLLGPMFPVIKTAVKTNPSPAIKEFLSELQAAIVKFTINRACDLNIIQVTADGLLIRTMRPHQQSGRDFNIQAQRELANLANITRLDGEKAIETVINHLNKEASETKYQDWFNSDAYTAPPKGGETPHYTAEPNHKIYMS